MDEHNIQNMNIFEKMSGATEDIAVVAKNLNVGYGNNKYKAVSEADVLAAVKPIERKYGIYSYPLSRTIVDKDILTFKNSKNEEKTNMFLRVETVYRFVNINKPEEFIDIVTYGDGMDSQDKAPGKAMTYGDKYALLKAYKIQTGDDPDANASEENTTKVYTNQNSASQQFDPAYPERKVMISTIEKHYPVGKSRDALLAFLKSESLDKATDAQLQAVYNKVAAK